MARGRVRPVGEILVEFGGSIVVRLFDQNVIVPQAQRNARQALGDGSDVRMQGQRSQRRLFLPGVHKLNEDRPFVQAAHAMR